MADIWIDVRRGGPSRHSYSRRASEAVWEARAAAKNAHLALQSRRKRQNPKC